MSLSAFYTRIKTDVSGFFAKLPAAEQQLISKLEPILTGAAGDFFRAMLPLGESLVLQYATHDKPGAQKSAEVTAAIEAAAIQSGLEVVNGVAGLITNAAYAKAVATGAIAPAVAPVAPASVANTGASAPAPASVASPGPVAPAVAVPATVAPATVAPATVPAPDAGGTGETGESSQAPGVASEPVNGGHETQAAE